MEKLDELELKEKKTNVQEETHQANQQNWNKRSHRARQSPRLASSDRNVVYAMYKKHWRHPSHWSHPPMAGEGGGAGADGARGVEWATGPWLVSVT